MRSGLFSATNDRGGQFWFAALQPETNNRRT